MSKILDIFICATVLLIAGCAQANKSDAGLIQPQEPSAAQKGTEPAQGLAQAPDEMLSTFSVSGYAKGGQKQWDLEGKSADIRLEMIKLMEVTGKVYGKKVNMTIVADEGSLDRINNNVHLEKNVCATTDDGACLRTDYLDWDAQNERLSSDAFVRLERGVMEAWGTGLIAQPVLNLVQLNKNVTVNLDLQEKQDVPAHKEQDSDTLARNEPQVNYPTVITCDGPLEVEYEKNLAIFQDNVVVKDKRGKILADKMDVYFSSQSDEDKQLEGMEAMAINKVVATGNVEIYHGSNITYSQEAVYDTETGKLTLTGQPKLVIYSTEGFSQLMGGHKADEGKSDTK